MRLILCLVVAMVLAQPVRAQDTDGDGLLDLIDVPRFNPRASGSLIFTYLGIQDLDGASLLTAAKQIYLSGNLITSIESGDLEGLTNLQVLYLHDNQITSIESGAFAGMDNLVTLRLEGNSFAELNFTKAVFENLRKCERSVGTSDVGFCLLPSPSLPTGLTLDDATLSLDSFGAITRAVEGIADVSLVGLSFSDGNPLELNNLLVDITTLDNVRVDQNLFDSYADEFNAFDAMAGNTVTVVVPEPSTGILAGTAFVAMLGAVAVRRRRSSASGRNVI